MRSVNPNIYPVGGNKTKKIKMKEIRTNCKNVIRYYLLIAKKLGFVLFNVLFAEHVLKKPDNPDWDSYLNHYYKLEYAD